MDDDIEVRESNIAGRGVFATRDFGKGETVLVWDTSHVVPDELYDSIPAEDCDFLARYKGQWIVMQPPVRFMNHSCDSNTRAHDGADVAIRDIAAGEEITTDYRPEMQAGERMLCTCSTPECEGVIIGTNES